MIQYCNFEVRQGNNRVELCADYFYVPRPDENGTFVIGTPQCWDDTFLNRFSLDGYECLHVYTHLIESKDANRITDHKGVWGLKHIPRGVYNHCYDFCGKRLYFGIDKSNSRKNFLTQKAATVIIVPESLHIEYGAIFSCFCNAYSNLCENVALSSLERICEIWPCVITLHYSTHGRAQLTIMGSNVDSLFSEEDCLIWKSKNTVPLFHHS